MGPPDGKIHAIAGGAAAPLALRRASEFKDLTPPERDWHVPNLVPAANVTLLYGDGSTGKSLLALQLTASTVLGRQWIGLGVKQGPAVFFSAEDEMPELHRRLDSICEAEGVDFDALDNLHIVSLADEDARLLGFNHQQRHMHPTPHLYALDAALAEIRPALVVLDTLADLHDGNEIEKPIARQVIGHLRWLAMRHRCAVVVLAHPSLSGMSSGKGTSGNTAWSNSARSRLFLDRVTEDGYEPNRDARKLSLMKSNYAPIGREIHVSWRHGVFVADRPETTLDRRAEACEAERVFMDLLRQLTAQGIQVNASGGTKYAPTYFESDPDSARVTKKAFARAMHDLLRQGRIRLENHGTEKRPRCHIAKVEG